MFRCHKLAPFGTLRPAPFHSLAILLPKLSTTVGSKMSDNAPKAKILKPAVVPAFLLNDPSLGCPFCGSAGIVDNLWKHKQECGKYQELCSLFAGREVEGDSTTKKRECPITEQDDDSDTSSCTSIERQTEDKENVVSSVSSPTRKKRLTKHIPVATVRSVEDLNIDGPPFLHIPGVGKGSPPDLLLGGCRCCGKHMCKFNNFTVFDLGAEGHYFYSTEGEYDPDGTPMSDLPLRHFYLRNDPTVNNKEMGMAVRDAVHCLLNADEMFWNHKFMGHPAFEMKLRTYFSAHLSECLVGKYWIPLRLTSKLVLAFHRMSSIDAIRERVIGM